MKVIGLTGGIGTGKSTVSAYLREKGCRVIDADRIAHQMTKKEALASRRLKRFSAKRFSWRTAG